MGVRFFAIVPGPDNFETLPFPMSPPGSAELLHAPTLVLGEEYSDAEAPVSVLSCKVLPQPVLEAKENPGFPEGLEGPVSNSFAEEDVGHEASETEIEEFDECVDPEPMTKVTPVLKQEDLVKEEGKATPVLEREDVVKEKGKVTPVLKQEDVVKEEGKATPLKAMVSDVVPSPGQQTVRYELPECPVLDEEHDAMTPKEQMRLANAKPKVAGRGRGRGKGRGRGGRGRGKQEEIEEDKALSDVEGMDVASETSTKGKRKPGTKSSATTKVAPKAKAKGSAKAKASSRKKAVVEDEPQPKKPKTKHEPMRATKRARSSEPKPKAKAKPAKPAKSQAKQQKAELERKAKLSRKSAAYHRAVKAGKEAGKSDEECKKLGKAAIGQHIQQVHAHRIFNVCGRLCVCVCAQPRPTRAWSRSFMQLWVSDFSGFQCGRQGPHITLQVMPEASFKYNGVS